MNYNTEEWLSIRVNADKLIYCKTGTLSRSKFPFSFQSAVQVFFEDVFFLSLSLEREKFSRNSADRGKDQDGDKTEIEKQ